MKTFIITLTLVLGLLFSGNASAQSFDKIFKKYKNEDNVTSIKIGKLGCMFASLFAGGDDDAQQFIKKSSGVRILVNENGTNSSLMTDLYKYIDKSKLEQLMNVKDGDDNIDIYILDQDKVIKQLLIVVSDKEDQVILNLDGMFPLQMIKEMMNDKKSTKSIKAKL